MDLLLYLLIDRPIIQYEKPLIIEQVEIVQQEEEKPVTELVEDDRCYCVRGAQYHSPMNVPSQDAKDFIKNSSPVIGGLVLMEYYNVSHVAVIKYFIGKGAWIVEWNYDKCAETERFIAFDDPHVVGFWVE